MLLDANATRSQDALALAREQLRVGPVPDWVVPCQPDYGFVPQGRETQPSASLLLWNVQANLECNTTHVHVAIRLEDMQAVQRESQWRLEFEPKTQQATIHWIKVRRGEAEVDHTDLNKIHLLQREAGLEGCIIDGAFTALLLIEDVRPGDVLEWCYTTEVHPRLLPQHRHALFKLPAAPIGTGVCIVRFNEARPMKWKASDEELQPEEYRENQQVVWRWVRENCCYREPEINVPAWHSVYPWIQVSDCPDWGVVARAVAAAWEEGCEGGSDEALSSLVGEVRAKDSDLLARLEQALRLVQDEFRYLSVNLEHGGQIPTHPDSVARRRFGDCKDLSALLVHILRQLEIPARPVLVSASRCRGVATMLPSPNLFDHVVVEFAVRGETRWVDATIKNQGGGPLNRVLPSFGFGLVVDSATTSLAAPPAASVAPGTYRIRESLLLDTTGANSSVAIVATATGREAEMMRHQFGTIPLAQIAHERLMHCASRYGNAQRVGELKFRDDREVNEFHIAEVFEVNGFLSQSSTHGFCDFYLPPNLINGTLRLPDAQTRRDQFALPQPCTLTHIYDVQSGGIQNAFSPRRHVGSACLQFAQRVRSMPGIWSVTMDLTVLDEVVMPDQFDEHLRRVQDIWGDTSWKLTLPIGYSAAGRNRAFGTLPSPRQPLTKTAAPQRGQLSSPRVGSANDASVATRATASSDAPLTQGASRAGTAEPIDLVSQPKSRHPRRRRSRRRRQPWSSTKLQWMIVIGCCLLVILLFALMTLFILSEDRKLGLG